MANAAARESMHLVVTEQLYENVETADLVALVNDAADLVHKRGDRAFDEFRVQGSRWREGDRYVFVLQLDGKMLVHPDPGLEGKNELGLRDVNGKLIIQGLINAATLHPEKPEGWFHYEWPIPGDIFPRWKSSYVQLAKAPDGNRYVVGAGLYNDRMERTFVVDLVTDAVSLIEKSGSAAFDYFRDPKGPFVVKDAYIFVSDMDGIQLFNSAFPNLQGRSLFDYQDTQGKYLIREMIQTVKSRGFGWVDYMWPKPGESVATQKSAYVTRANLNGKPVMVGCGVYLADAPKATLSVVKMTAPDLENLVHEAAIEFEKGGENAFPAFRENGTKWFHDEAYFFVWTMDGRRLFHAADPTIEGQDVRQLKDIIGRPIGEMILDIGKNPFGEGWIHYMYPKPGGIFPNWKSTFVKRVKFPSGGSYLIGCGIYDMKMDKAFIEDVVDRAASLVAEYGVQAFAELRDRKGPFVFMDTYVFVQTPEGTELVNGAYPSLEGRNLLDVKDATGIPVVRDEIAAAMESGSAWLDIYWYKPGTNIPAKKLTYVRKVDSAGQTYIVGSGYYVG